MSYTVPVRVFVYKKDDDDSLGSFRVWPDDVADFADIVNKAGLRATNNMGDDIERL